MTPTLPQKSRRRLRPLLLCALLVVCLAGGLLTAREVLAVRDTSRWVAHTREVLLRSGDVRSELGDAELAVRGYLLTGNLSHVDRYALSRAAVLAQLGSLRVLTADNRAQEARVADLQERVEARLGRLDAVARAETRPAVGGGRDPAAGTHLAAAGLQAVLAEGDGPLQALHEFETEEDRLLAERSGATDAALRRTLWTVGGATASLMALLLGFATLMRQQRNLVESAMADRRGFDRARGEMATFHQRVLDSTAEGVFGLDAEGKCTFMNRAGALMLGAEPEHFLGRKMHDEVHHSRADGTSYAAGECSIQATLDGSAGARVEDEVFWRPDGECFPVEFTAFPLAPGGHRAGGGGGTEGGAVVNFADISAQLRARDELREARDAAEAASEAKSQFLANMSHELRTPLNAVIMYSELLAEEAQDRGQEDFIPDLKKIRGAGRHLLELVNGVLDLSKIEAGKMELFFEAFALEPMLREIEATVEPLMSKNGNRFSWSLDPALGEMTGDLVKVRQVLYNLLSNAAKFTSGGPVALAVTPGDEPGTIDFAVTDSGIGMSRQQVDQLFQPFVQADASTTRRYGGTGLGLAIIRRFTDLLGGTVAVESEEGRGTRFLVTLPREPAEGLAGRQERGPAVERPTAPTAVEATAPRVLIIDDDPAVRDTLVRVLLSEGLQPHTASDGAEGLLRAAELKPALIILDVKMPLVDGWAVLTSLKADPELADVPVVLQSVEDERNLGMTLGAVEFLVKPVDRSRLVRVVQSYLHGPDATALVVDDDAVTREAIAKGLEERGWKTLHAGHGAEAIEQLEAAGESLPLVVLLDLNMPVMDGFEFIEELAKRPAWSEIPVVVLTAQDLTTEDRLRLQAGVERVLQKTGMDRAAFLQHVRKLVMAVTHPAEPPRLGQDIVELPAAA